MILPDANVLIYAIDERSARHAAARVWLEATLSGTETVAFSWSVLTAVLRLVTHPSVVSAPLSVGDALDLIDAWLEPPHVITINPTERHTTVLRDLLGPTGVAGNLVPDAHLAALAVEHGATVASTDHDFARFPGLRWADPLHAPRAS